MLILLLCLIGQENRHGEKRQLDTVEGERRNDGWTDGNELGNQHNGKKKRQENWTSKKKQRMKKWKKMTGNMKLMKQQEGTARR